MNQAAKETRTPQGEETVPTVGAHEVIRRFISYYRPYSFLFFFDLFCAVILACVDLAFPQLLNFFTRDFFLQPADVILQSLIWILLFFVVLYLIRTGCQYFITRWGHIMGARMEADMRRDIFEQYQRLSFSYYDRHNTGTMMSKIVTDLFDISELAHHGPENLFICGLKIIGSFVLLFLVNVPLTAIMLAATVVMAVYSFWRNYQKRLIFSRNRARMADINSTVQDSLGGIRIVKSFGNEQSELDKFDHANAGFLDTKEQSYSFMGSFHAANSLFIGVLYTTTIVGGGYFVAQGTLQPTDMAIYALYIGIFVSPVEQLINFTETFQKGYAGFRRFIEVLAEDPDVKDAPHAVPLSIAVQRERAANGTGFQAVRMASVNPQDLKKADRNSSAGSSPVHVARQSASPGVISGAIAYNHVTFSYEPGVPVLQDLNLSIPAGTTMALVGPSGGGKTTTCSLLPRFYDPDSGTVEIDGVDIRDVTLSSLRQAIGIVQQDVYLFGGTVRDNIAYGNPDASDEEIIEAAKRANIHSFALSLPDGYDTLVGERGARLSGGQKQRIAIARVFLRNPQILILDEATSALDNESEGLIQQSLAELSAGRTTLIIAHRLSTIKDAQTIAVIDAGRVAEIGAHRDLLDRNGIYARYHRMQFGG